MQAHIDGDVLVYRAGFAAEHTFWNLSWEGLEREFEAKKELLAFMESQGLSRLDCVITSRVEAEPVEHALFNARSMIRKMVDELEADEPIVYLSGPTNFRLGVAKTLPYKGNRDPSHKPVHAAEIKAMMRREYDVVTSDGQEADDDISIAHYATWLKDPYGTVICTIDKDLDMVPGLHYNFAKEERYYIEPLEGLWHFYKQCLTGDTTDNIPGIAGIGPVKAVRALPAVGSPEPDLYRAVLELYTQAYGDQAEERLRETGTLLWMRRHPNDWWAPPEVTS